MYSTVLVAQRLSLNSSSLLTLKHILYSHWIYTFTLNLHSHSIYIPIESTFTLNLHSHWIYTFAFNLHTHWIYIHIESTFTLNLHSHWTYIHIEYSTFTLNLATFMRIKSTFSLNLHSHLIHRFTFPSAIHIWHSMIHIQSTFTFNLQWHSIFNEGAELSPLGSVRDLGIHHRQQVDDVRSRQ